MAKKKKTEETAVEEVIAEPKKESGPKLWHCPHCGTFYRDDMKTAQKNHLANVHGK